MSVQPHNRSDGSLISYAAPMVVFALVTALESYASATAYVWLYAAKAVAVTLTLVYYRDTLRDIQPSWRVIALATLVGVVVFAQWILLDIWVPYPHIGNRVGFDPFTQLTDQRMVGAFLFVRLYGLVLLVPVMEELFMRSFLLRYLTDADFLSVPIGRFSTTAFVMVIGVSAIAHPEWLAAAVTACAYGWLLYATRSLFATFVAHAVTNGALGIYVLVSHNWQYW